MKAWQFSTAAGGLEKNLTLNAAATAPTILPNGSVFIEVISASLNPVDYKLAEIPIASKLVYAPPASPGIDFCGRVATTSGTGVLKEGQRVFGRLDKPTKFGTLGQFIIADSWKIGVVPEGVDDDSAAAVGTAALTSYQCLKLGALTEGSKVFINGGSGGTGTWAIQFAKVMGSHVTTTCSTGNVELCRSLGADEIIDYTKGDLIQTLKNKGQTFDLVFDTVGSPPSLYNDCHHFLKPNHRFVQVGAEPNLSTALSLASRMLRPGFLGGGKRPFTFHDVHSSKEELEVIGKWMQEKKVKAVFDQVCEWEDVPKAYERLKSGRAKGKIVVHVMANDWSKGGVGATIGAFTSRQKPSPRI